MNKAKWAMGAAAAVCLGSAALAAQQFQPATPRPAFETVQIKTTDLGTRTYMLEGDGGNIVLAVGDDGVIMIDSQFPEFYGKIKAAIAAVTPLPVRYLAITHFHRDHTGGNPAFAKDGAVIVGHDAMRARLESGTTNGLTGNVLAPAVPEALPVLTFSEAMTIRVKGREARLQHVHAHTDGDTVIHFPDANVLVTGDIVTFGRYPNIDVPYGGDIERMIAALDGVLKLANETTKIVPGHGSLGTKAQMAAYRQMLADARDRVKALIAAGKSEDEAVAAKPNADYDAKLGVTAQAAGNFVRVVYRSLKS